MLMKCFIPIEEFDPFVPIETLNLPSATEEKLKAAGVVCVGRLVQMRRKEGEKIAGKYGATRVIGKLQTRSLYLGIELQLFRSIHMEIKKE